MVELRSRAGSAVSEFASYFKVLKETNARVILEKFLFVSVCVAVLWAVLPDFKLSYITHQYACHISNSQKIFVEWLNEWMISYFLGNAINKHESIKQDIS